jgi:metallophosphoesterase (TIGR00282 family)
VKLLFIGDIVGEPGRRAVNRVVPALRASLGIDVVVGNGENAAGGSGITRKTADALLASGIDIITTGDHVWDQKEITDWISQEKRVLRPLNYPDGTAGFSSAVIQPVSTQPAVAVLNVQGRTFMPAIENPFVMARREVERLRQITPLIVVDIHAEATSEKIAMARMLDGQVSAVIGTHTHVQTADEQIYPGGTAFLCDAGFTGPHESILGRDISAVIRRFLTNVPQRFEVASERVLLQGALVEIDAATGKAVSIRRISEACA